MEGEARQAGVEELGKRKRGLGTTCRFNIPTLRNRENRSCPTGMLTIRMRRRICLLGLFSLETRGPFPRHQWTFHMAGMGTQTAFLQNAWDDKISETNQIPHLLKRTMNDAWLAAPRNVTYKDIKRRDERRRNERLLANYWICRNRSSLQTSRYLQPSEYIDGSKQIDTGGKHAINLEPGTNMWNLEVLVP